MGYEMSHEYVLYLYLALIIAVLEMLFLLYIMGLHFFSVIAYSEK